MKIDLTEREAKTVFSAMLNLADDLDDAGMDAYDQAAFRRAMEKIREAFPKKEDR